MPPLFSSGLGKSRDTIVGDDRVRGVSGDERKRVSVGIEVSTAFVALPALDPTWA